MAKKWMTIEEFAEPSLGAPQTYDAADPQDLSIYSQLLMERFSALGTLPKYMVYGGQDQTVQYLASPDQRVAWAMAESARALADLYGTEQLASYIEAARIDDPAQRAEYFEKFRNIQSGTYTFETRQGTRRGAPVTEYQNPLTGEWSVEKPDVSPEAFQYAGVSTLTQRDAALTAFLASQTPLRDEEGNLVESYEWDLVLSETEQEQIMQGVAQAKANLGGEKGLLDTAARVASGLIPGVQQARLGGAGTFEGSFLTLDTDSGALQISEEWARAHPVKAIAAARMIQAGNPAAIVNIGERSLASATLDKLGRPIDYVWGGPALVAKGVYRRFGEVGEQFMGIAGEDREYWVNKAQQIEQGMREGAFAPEDMPEVMDDLQRAKDLAEGFNIFNEGEDFESELYDAFTPENAGTSLANSYMDGVGLLPSDPGYNEMHAAITLIHNLSIADPVGWAADAMAGAKLARTITTGRIANSVRNAATVKGVYAGLDKGGTASRYLADSQWVSVTTTAKDASDAVNNARTAAVYRAAEAMGNQRGYDVVRVTNPDGTTDVMVLGMSAEEGLALARGAGIDNFKTADGIIHNDRTITPANWGGADDVTDIHAADASIIHFKDKAVPFRMEIPDKTIRVKVAAPKVSRNYIIQKSFEAAARTPDELLYSDRAVDISGRIFSMVENARALGLAEAKAEEIIDGLELATRARNKAHDVLSLWSPSYDPAVLRALSEARSQGDVHSILTAAVTGGITDPYHIERVAQRQAEIAERLGEIENEMAQYGRLTEEIAELGRQAGADHISDTLMAMLSSNPATSELAGRWYAGQRMLRKLDRERIDLLGERYSNQSILELDDLALPIRQLPSDKLVEELEQATRAAGRDDVEELIHAIAVTTDEGKGELITHLDELLKQRGVNARQAARIKKRADAARRGRSQRVFHSWLNTNTAAMGVKTPSLRDPSGIGRYLQALFRQNHRMTGGAEIYMPLPGHGVPEGSLVDYTMRSLNTIRDRARLYGLNESDVAALTGSYLRIKNRQDWYRWVRKFYEDIADRSPFLDARARAEVRQTHQDLLSERGGGYLAKLDGDGVAHADHTLSRVTVDPVTGQKVRSGIPVFSGDWIDNKIRLPSNEFDAAHLSRTKRWQERAILAGGKPGVAAQMLMGVRDVVSASTYVWKMAILMGKMPFALAARIQGEQMLRMAALDQASAAYHPLEWFRAMRGEGEYGRFVDTHDDLLGVIIDNAENNDTLQWNRVRVMRRGRTVLSPLDGDRYWNALSIMFRRRWRSPEVRFYINHEPQEILDWLRSRESGMIGTGILDNLVASAPDDVTDMDAFLLDALTRAKKELTELAGGSDEVSGILRRGASPKKETYLELQEGRQTMKVKDLRKRLEWGPNRGERTKEQLAALKNSLRGGYDESKGGLITVHYDPETQKIIVPEGHHRIDALDQLGTKEIPVNVVYVDTPTVERVGSALPPRVPAAPVVLKTDTPRKVGSRQFGTYLRKEAEAGRYTPPQFINGKASEYMMEDDPGLIAAFRDWAFQKFYSGPDIRRSRGPLYRQFAAKEFDRLIGLGWSEKRAEGAAAAYAAEQTADWMYDLSARTSSQYWAKNIFPFFPAWQELGGVWLMRLPASRGGGGFAGWAAGAALFATRADALGNFFVDTGMVTKNAKGEWEFGIPGLDAIWQFLTGDEDAKLRLNANNLIGMLPVPGLGQALPGLGPWPSAALGLMARHNDLADEIANVVLPFGNDVRLGPASINHLFHAAGYTPPWEYMTADTDRLLQTFALEDAILSVQNEMEPFDESWSDARKKAWSEELISRAEKRSTVNYLLRAVSSMVLPTTVTITSEHKKKMEEVWKFIGAYEEGTGESASSAMIDSFKAEYPDAVWYSNGRTINHAPEREGGDFDDFIKEWRDNQIRTFTPDEFVEWNLGMTNYWATVSAAGQASKGMTAPELLTNGFNRKSVTNEKWSEFESYLASHPVFEGLYNEYLEARDEGPKLSTSALQDRLVRLRRDLGAAADLFTVNGVRDGDYLSTMGKVSENIEYIAKHSDDPVWEAYSWWWENVGTPAGEELDALYEQAFSLPSQERGPIFEQIRQLKNSWQNVTYQGQVFPTLEEVWWGNKSLEEQQIKILELATNPLEWSSDFERSKLGMESKPGLDEMFAIMTRNEQAVKQWAAENYISPSSAEYQEAQARGLLEAAQFANENGLIEEFAMTQAAPYQRVLMTQSYRGNATFEGIAEVANQLKAVVEAQGYSFAGSSELARRAQEALFQRIDAAKDADPEFKDLMDDLEIAMAQRGEDRAIGPDMYFRFWINYFGPTPTINYQYSA